MPGPPTPPGSPESPTTEPTLQSLAWPGDGRLMLRLPGGLWVDEAPVTHADYARFVAATGHAAPRGWCDAEPPAGRELHPVVDVDIEDARAYARWANKRLPLQREWMRAVHAVDFVEHLDGGRVWEWTGSPYREGHVVRGGPYRNRPTARGAAPHRSWEDTGALDLGFRCVADDSLCTLDLSPPRSVDDDDDVIVDAGVDGIVTTPRGVAVVGDGVVVHVDVADLELVVRAPGLRRRLGLTSAGVLLAVQLAVRLCGQRLSEHAILLAIDEAVRRHALRVRPELAGVEEVLPGRGFEVVSPLLWSRGVVLRPHVVKDVLGLRPAGIALEMLDRREDGDDTSPEYAALLAETFANWRRLYRHPESTVRSVNRTLARYGDDATATGLWGLRGLALKAPVTSLQHLEVLGHLALVTHDDQELALLRDVVERATAAELGEALVLVGEGEVVIPQGWQTPAGQLAEILLCVSISDMRDMLQRRPRFRELLAEALHALRHVLRLRTVVAEPPIPPPSAIGVRFLATVAEIAEEGVRMDHCVATRAPRALAGQSYLFHIDHDGESATAEVLATGQLAEVRGPGNRNNGACRRACQILRPWGCLVALFHPNAPAFVVPADAASTSPDVRLLRSAPELARATLDLLPGTVDAGNALVAFALDLVIDAAAGRCLVGFGEAQGLCRLSLDGALDTCSAKLTQPVDAAEDLDLRDDANDDDDIDYDLWEYGGFQR